MSQRPLSPDSGPDDAPLEQLRTALRPSSELRGSVVQSGIAAFAWRTIDIELAELLAEPPRPLVTTRSPETGRHFTFDSGTTVVDLVIEEHAGSLILRGWIDPATEANVRIVGSDGTEVATCTSDDLGRFRVTAMAHGPVRLEVTRDPLLCTEWFQLG